MLIGIDGSRAFIKDKTGTENYSYQLLKTLAKIDTEHDYLIYIRPGQNPGKNWPKNFKFQLINFQFLWTQAGLAIRTFLDPIDLLFVPAHTLPLIRKPLLKTVITVHDLGAEYLPGSHQLKQFLYLKLMTHYQLKSASKVIAVSNATKADLMKKAGLSSEKIEVVYEGVEEGFGEKGVEKNDAQRDLLNHYRLQSGRYFLFVGTIQPRKNLKRLIIAFTKFLSQADKDSEHSVLGSMYHASREKKHNTKYTIHNTEFKLVLVGQKGWKSGGIYNLPEKLGLSDKVKFIGRVSDRELIILYKNATALSYPSLFEGFGLPILEAFAAGCPVITSNISSMPEIAGDAALLVDPYNEQEITEAMVKFVTDDRFRDTLIQKGYNRVRYFSWEKAARKTVEIFNKLK